MANNNPALSVRLNPEDKKALQELAHHKRLTVSELVLKSLKPSIRKGLSPLRLFPPGFFSGFGPHRLPSFLDGPGLGDRQ